MEKRTLEALKASIAKWERNAVAETPSDVTVRARDCPLCVMFNLYLRGSGSAACAGCPVAAATGLNGCENTPYSAAEILHDIWEDIPKSDEYREKFSVAALNEVAFLKSLLPPEEAP